MSEESPKYQGSPAIQSIVDTLGFDRRPGAVLICDALGFKGLWRGRESEFFDALSRVRGAVKRLIDGFMEHDREQVETGFYAFSDTLAWTVRIDPKGIDSEEKWEKIQTTVHCRTISMAAFAAIALQHRALQIEPALAFRGSVAYGPFKADPAQQILVGEAVEEAGADYERAEGAFIRLTPSARSIADDFAAQDESAAEVVTRSKRQPSFLARYAVPVRDAGVIEGWVADPFSVPDSNSGSVLQPADFIHRIRATFDRAGADPHVEKMWQNTRRFLEHCSGKQDGKPAAAD